MLEPGTLRSQSLAFIMEWGIDPDIEEPFAFSQHFVAVGFHLLTGGQRRSALAEGEPSRAAAVSRDPDRFRSTRTNATKLQQSCVDRVWRLVHPRTGCSD